MTTPFYAMPLSVSTVKNNIAFPSMLRSISIANDGSNSVNFQIGNSGVHNLKPGESVNIDSDYPFDKMLTYTDSGTGNLRILGIRKFENGSALAENDQPTSITRLSEDRLKTLPQIVVVPQENNTNSLLVQSLAVSMPIIIIGLLILGIIALLLFRDKSRNKEKDIFEE